MNISHNLESTVVVVVVVVVIIFVLFVGCGPIQLWQFLLELLLDSKCQSFIHWTDKEWEFKLVNPEEVAKKWGQRKKQAEDEL